MNIFLTEEELVEIKPLEETKDKGLVINPAVGKREDNNIDLVKEITALDTLSIGSVAASKINGVPQSSASKYSNGKDISNIDARARINSAKYEIEDTAVSKLMETLQLINPHEIEKTRDKIALISGLSSLVDKISGNNDKEGKVQVTLNLYAPNQRKENEYETIEA